MLSRSDAAGNGALAVSLDQIGQLGVIDILRNVPAPESAGFGETRGAALFGDGGNDGVLECGAHDCSLKSEDRLDADSRDPVLPR